MPAPFSWIAYLVIFVIACLILLWFLRELGVLI